MEENRELIWFARKHWIEIFKNLGFQGERGPVVIDDSKKAFG